MSKLTKLLLTAICVGCSMLFSVALVAQERDKITGRIVASEDQSPLQGATIVLDGSKTSTLSDAAGRFEITAPKNARLTISMVGFQTRKIAAGAGSMFVELTRQDGSLEELVVVGYGTQKRELLTGSVVTMKMDEPRRNTPTTSLGNLLAGQMAGVRVGTPNGIPGTQPGINIRVASSFNAQNVLYVIDGKVSGASDFNNLSPNDIENISVLKDAASSAVYGSRAAGGVIVVTTRRGKSGRAQINYSFSTGFEKRGKNAELTSAVETGELYNRINPNSDPAGWRWTQDDLDYFKGINNGWGYDQLDAVWQDPSTTAHNLGISGGGEKIKYFVGGSYIKQGAFMKNLSYDKYNLRTNITADLTKNLSLFAGLTVNNNLSYSPTNTSVGDIQGIYRKQLLWQPDQPVWTDAGNPIDYGWIGNVGAEVRGDGGYIKSNGIKPILNLQATYKIAAIKGLSASAQFNKSYTNNRGKSYMKQYNMWVMKKTGLHQISTKDEDLVTLKRSSQVGRSFIREDHSWSNDYQLNFQLSYDRTFHSVHNVKGWLIYEKAEAQGGGIFAGRESFPVYLTDQWWAASGDRLDSYANGNPEFITGRKSWVGQFFYDYDNKYMASFAYRYDGSMNFAPDQRWGFFPSASAGWILSKENFFSKVKNVEMLKLRASAGLVGNDGIGGWQWLQSYSSANPAYFGTNGVTNPGITYGSLVNTSLTWEKSMNYNIGVDINFHKHFTASLEYYTTRTYDILGSRINSVPPTFSRTIPASNYGEIKARGIEAMVGYRNTAGQVNYYANVNAAYGNANYVIQDQNITYPWQKNPGNSTSRVTGYEVIGMIRTQADLDRLLAANPNYKWNGVSPALGQLIYKDLSGVEGKPDGIIDSWDITTLRKRNNPISVGLNMGLEWKGLSIDASFSGNFNQFRYVNNLVTGNVEWNRMWRNWYTDGWTPENTSGSLPIRYSINDGTQWVTNSESDFWLKNSSFLRLRLLNVGYQLPDRITNIIGLQGLKLFFSGSNLFMFSRFGKDFYDPELGDGFSYPTMKNFNFGVNVSL